jgi:hypothetical protein
MAEGKYPFPRAPLLFLKKNGQIWIRIVYR